MRTIIRHAILVNEGKTFEANLVIENGLIAGIFPKDETLHDSSFDQEIDATGLYLLPGVIDDHVHFREPGLTHKADIESESKAAVAGGVTSYLDMPNTVPQTTDLKSLEEKFALASEKSYANYSFFFGATNDNTHLLSQLDQKRICGIKLFMGSSTGNMLVDKDEALIKLFNESPMLIMAHCEDQTIINQNAAHIKEVEKSEDPDVKFHPFIRNEEACYRSTAKAIELARKANARLHIAHVSTSRELELFDSIPLNDKKRITAEACVAHLYFSENDYTTLGTQIKCNPAIKTKDDRKALQKALHENRIDLIGTDHAPHLLSEKKGGCLKAVSGMPMIQFSLVTMLELVDQGVLTLPLLVEKMCHAPARLFEIKERGYLRIGYHADLVLVRPNTLWIVDKQQILSKCAWSPLEGHQFNWKVEKTFVNGECIYDKGFINENIRGKELEFNR